MISVWGTSPQITYRYVNQFWVHRPQIIYTEKTL